MRIESLVQYAYCFIGIPYRWGGENPISGFDCSGLVQEILKSAGFDPPGDQSAQALYNHFRPQSIHSVPSSASLLFFGKTFNQITHVAFGLDADLMIEAGGGDSSVINKESADLKSAFVRVRPISSRKDLVAILNPFKFDNVPPPTLTLVS